MGTKLNRSTIKKSPVTPLTFKKLKDDIDSMSSGSTSDRSSGNVKNEKLSGVVNNAYNDSILSSGQNEADANYQETDFNDPKTVSKVNYLTQLVDTDFNNYKELTRI